MSQFRKRKYYKIVALQQTNFLRLIPFPLSSNKQSNPEKKKRTQRNAYAPKTLVFSPITRIPSRPRTSRFQMTQNC